MAFTPRFAPQALPRTVRRTNWACVGDKRWTYLVPAAKATPAKV